MSDTGGLALSLTGALGRPVIDDTGLTGGFDLALTWTPDTPDGPAAASAVSLFPALQDQLSLKAEAKNPKTFRKLIFPGSANTEPPARSKLTAG